ncbi:hypothetical protein AB6C49_04745 [Vibrio cyclitrophicus]
MLDLMSEIKEVLPLVIRYVPDFLFTLLALFITYQQYKILKDKPALELLEKRYLIYQRAADLHKNLFTKELDTNAHEFFIESMQSARFLFPDTPRVHELLEKIHENYTVAKNLHNDKDYNHPNEVLIQNRITVETCRREIGSNIKEMEQLLRPYLSTHHSFC